MERAIQRLEPFLEPQQRVFRPTIQRPSTPPKVT